MTRGNMPCTNCHSREHTRQNCPEETAKHMQGPAEPAARPSDTSEQTETSPSTDAPPPGPGTTKPT